MWTQIKLSFLSVLNPTITRAQFPTLETLNQMEIVFSCDVFLCIDVIEHKAFFFANSSVPPFKINWISSASARSYFQKMPLIYSKQKKRVKSTRWALFTVESFLAFIIVKTCLTLSI